MTQTTPDPSDELQDRAAAHDRNGWGPIPLPTGKKAQPPEGFTGQKHPRPSYADWYTEYSDNPAAWGNLGVRVPDGVVGVDVDAYDGKNGAATWDLIGHDYPPTVRLSSRFIPGKYDSVSGIRFYRLPDSIDQSELWGAHDGIEILRFGHRYAVAPGSLHPEGTTYQVFDEAARAFLDLLPPIDTLPELTVEQATRLTTAGAPWRGQATDAPPRVKDTAGICSYSMTILTRAMRDLQSSDSRYQTMSDAVWALISGEDEGHHLGSALETLKLAYFQATAADRKKAGAESPLSEFDRNVTGARAKVAELPTDPMFQGCCASEQPPVTPPDTAPSDSPFTDEAADPDTGTDPDAGPSPYEQAVRRKYADLRVNEDAKEMLSEHRVGQAKPLTGMNLTDFLGTQYEEERYRVGDIDRGLWPSDGRVLLAAAAKTGKTTMVACNLIPSLADGTPFLGRYDVQPVTGTIVYLNMEVGPRTMQRWIADAGIRNADKVIVENLRGAASALTIMSPKGRKRVADWLASHGAEIVILDPLAPLLAALEVDENSNSDVARFFGYWSETLQMAGVVDDLVVHHTGHAGERSRGASRLLDEPDAVWTLTKDQAGDDEKGSDIDDLFSVAPTRFLQAFGRDVELAAEALEFDPQTRLLGLSGESKGRAKKRVRQASTIDQIKGLLADGKARSKTAIADCLIGVQTNMKFPAVQTFIDTGHLYDTGLRVNASRKDPTSGGVLYLWTDTP